MTNTKEQELMLSLENTTEPIRRYLEKQRLKRILDDIGSRTLEEAEIIDSKLSYMRTSAIDKVTESKGE